MTEAGAARSVARERLAHHAERGLDLEYHQSQRKLRERRDLQNELKGVETALRPADEARALQEAGTPHAVPLPIETENRLRARRDAVQDMINAPEMREADQTVRRASENEAAHGRRWTAEDHDRWIERRRRELARRAPAATDPGYADWMDRRLMAAGINPIEFRGATHEEQQQLLARAARASEIQRDLMRGVPDDGDLERLGHRDLRAIRRTIHDDEWRRARTQARRAIHREAWRRRARENVFRVRR
jgi:hypothetical protein